MQNTISRITLRNMTKFKNSQTENLKNLSLIQAPKFYLLLNTYKDVF